MTIQGPITWGWERVRGASRAIAVDEAELRLRQDPAARPIVRKIDMEDIKEALLLGWRDFGAQRTDVALLCLFYPIAGLLMGRVAAGYEFMPLIFPLVSGFALIGPFFAVGLNEMSRQIELGHVPNWSTAFGVARSPAFGAILALGMVLLALFVAWVIFAYLIFLATLGPQAPVSVGAFAHDVLATPRGWAMIVAGCGVGLVFAVVVLTISIVSFPLLLDRHVPLDVAVSTSIRAARRNPVQVATWGLIIAASLAIGSIPVLLGLIVVLPVLGHASWHLYRRLVLR